MTRTPDEQDPEMRAIAAECARIGFDVRELGGLAISGEDAMAGFLALLRAIPSGAGLEGFRQQVPGGDALWTLEDVLREDARGRATVCSFCGRPPTPDRILVHGPEGVAICSVCARVAAEIVGQGRQ